MKKDFSTSIPYLYFSGIIIWLFINGFNSASGSSDSYFILLLFTIPFIVQLFYKSKSLDLFLIAICTLWTCYMALAFLSDAADIITITAKAWQFLILGGLFTTTNLVFTIWLFFNYNKKEKIQTTNTLSE